MKSLVWQQNRHKKVYRGLYICAMGGLGKRYICAVGLDILKFEQISLFYSASYFSLGGSWSFVSERLSPPKPPRMVTGLCGKISACFLMELTRKST